MRQPTIAAIIVTTLGLSASAQAVQAPASQGPRPDVQPLGLVRLQNSRYTGLEDIPGEVELHAGRWEGEPPEPGSAIVPRVEFLGNLVARGDLDGDGEDEAAVILTTNFGGTGVFYHLAIVDQHGDENRNVATRLIDDRIQVRDLRIDEGHLALDLVRAGPGDAACCPTQAVSLVFRLAGGRLTDPVQQGATTALSLDLLEGRRWRLAAWKFGEPVNGRVTLAFGDGSFRGNAGCNEYSAAVQTVDDRGSIAVGQPRSARRQCGQDSMANETRFLALLPRVNRFWFHAGQLALEYGADQDFGVLFLAREE